MSLSNFFNKVKEGASDVWENLKEKGQKLKEKADEKHTAFKNRVNESANREKLLELIEKSAYDGTITPEELADISAIWKVLTLDASQMAQVKGQIVDMIVKRVEKDGTVSEQDMQMVNILTNELQITGMDSDFIEKKLQAITKKYQEQQNKA
jgi:hypothetical protein